VKQKWVSLMFSGSYIWTITKLLKYTNIKIAFKTNNTIGNILKERITTNKFEQTGIYRLTCVECKKVYTRQTGRTLKIRYKEHIHSIKYNREDSGFATYILNQRYSTWGTRICLRGYVTLKNIYILFNDEHINS
jgi:hypothetical protein